MNDGQVRSYKPSAYYWRKDIREATSAKELMEIALDLVEELEMHKAFIRRLGHIPPKGKVTQSEIRQKPQLLAFVRGKE